MLLLVCRSCRGVLPRCTDGAWSDRRLGAHALDGDPGAELRATSLATSPSTTRRHPPSRAGPRARAATPRAAAAWAIVLAGRRVAATWPQASDPPFSMADTALATISVLLVPSPSWSASGPGWAGRGTSRRCGRWSPPPRARPSLMRQRLADGRLGDRLAVRGDEHRGPLRRLLVELPPAELPPDRGAAAAGVPAPAPSPSQVGLGLHGRTWSARRLGATTVGPGMSSRSMPPGDPSTSGISSDGAIPRRLSLILRHQYRGT